MNVPPLPEFPSTLAKLDNLLITVTGFDHATLLSLAAIAVFVFVLPCQIDEYIRRRNGTWVDLSDEPAPVPDQPTSRRGKGGKKDR